MKRRLSLQVGVMVFVAACLVIGWKLASVNQQFAQNLLQGLPAQSAHAQRPVYPFSVVAGGIRSAAEIQESIKNDPIVAKHYGDIVPAGFMREVLAKDRLGYVSYRVGSRVFWTSHQLRIKAGELVLTDGETTIRTRCGNLIALKPPNSPPGIDPPEEALDTPFPPTVPAAPPVLVSSTTPHIPDRPVVPTEPISLPDLGVPTTGTIPPPPTGNDPPMSYPSVPPTVPLFPVNEPGPTVTPIAPVPELGTIILVGSGMVLVLRCARRQKKETHGESS